ncbi:MAG: hypothetical protein AAFR11_08210 [Pseudomonadota bacterium]
MSALENTVDDLAEALEALETAVLRRAGEIDAAGDADRRSRAAAADALAGASEALAEAIAAIDSALLTAAGPS